MSRTSRVTSKVASKASKVTADRVNESSTVQAALEQKSELAIPNAGKMLGKLKKFVPKPRPEVSAKLRRTLNSKPKKRRHFTDGVAKPLDQRKTDLSFKYPDDMTSFGYQLMSKAWRNDRRIFNLQSKLKDQKSFWQTLNGDLKERLIVEDPAKDKRLFITDIDPEYKTLVNNRPIKDSIPLQSYIECNRKLLKTKITLGYRLDDLALVDANIRTEQRMLELTFDNFQKYVCVFEEFLLRDHESGNSLLRQSNRAAERLLDAKNDCRNWKQMLQGMKSSLFKSESRWNVAKMYQTFLYECTPTYWKQNHKNSLMDSLTHKTCLDLFQEIQDNVEIKMDDILDTIKRECMTHEVQELYFTEPKQLMEVLGYMEEQNTNGLVYSAELQQPLTLIKEDMNTAAVNFDRMIQDLQVYIDGLERQIEWEEQRVVKMEELAHNLIFEHFKQIVSSPEVLNLHCFVEDIYESAIEPNTANLDARQMCSLIESHYISELFVLDTMPADEVVALQAETTKQWQDIIVLGEKAVKKHAETEITLKGVLRGYLPPYQKPLYKPLMFRSEIPVAPKKPPPPPRELSQNEQDYLDHFTQFCKFYDDPKDYGIDMSQEGQNKELHWSFTED